MEWRASVLAGVAEHLLPIVQLIKIIRRIIVRIIRRIRMRIRTKIRIRIMLPSRIYHTIEGIDTLAGVGGRMAVTLGPLPALTSKRSALWFRQDRRHALIGLLMSWRSWREATCPAFTA